ncbi:MAG: hypothetical protein R2742_13810 [Micropruina glycogenica]
MRFTDDARRARLARRHALHPGRRLTSVVDVARRAGRAAPSRRRYTWRWRRAARPRRPYRPLKTALYERRSGGDSWRCAARFFAFPRGLLPAVWGSASARVADAERGRLARDLEQHMRRS